jgi:hypothetical protein
MAGKMNLPHSKLLGLLDYNPEIGQFRWKFTITGTAKAGSIAGRCLPSGYRQIRVSGHQYLAHRLAWFYVNGCWPKSELDHRDGDRDNNRINNLREANASLNGANKGIPANNTSGAKGVRKRANNRWRASLEHHGKFISLGTYGSMEEASAAYFEGAQKIFGEFARVA